MTELQNGYVKIKGRIYKTIAKRVQEFWQEHDHAHWGIQTEILEITDEIVRVKATITCNYQWGPVIVGCGHAEETREGMINKFSAVENCETSAIGRALASIGYGGSDLDYASADEIQKVERMKSKKLSDEEILEIEKVADECYGDDAEEKLASMMKRVTFGPANEKFGKLSDVPAFEFQRIVSLLRNNAPKKEAE